MLQKLYNKDLVAYGTGVAGKIIIPILVRHPKIRLHGVTNTKATSNFGEMDINGVKVPIRSLHEWAKIMPNAEILVTTVNPNYQKEIAARCTGAGFKEITFISPEWVEDFSWAVDLVGYPLDYIFEEKRFFDLLKDSKFIAVLQRRLYGQVCIWGDHARVSIHETAYMANTLFNTNGGSISVGAHTFTGNNVCIITGTHDVTRKKKDRMEYYPKDGRNIKIGSGVFLGTNSTILGPCTIGDDAVIAAGAVVLSGTVVPPGTMFAGVPAKLVRCLDD